jgi:hypothetical protein
VWDNDAHTFGDGAIEKLFPSLPDGVSIGNPSFAKNSPYILAFDFVDDSADEYAILGCNVETNDVNVITENTTLGWPSFNKDDSRVAFTALNGLTELKTSFIALNSDKFHPTPWQLISMRQQNGRSILQQASVRLAMR